MRGSRLIDIVMDKQEDLLYEDAHNMRLTFNHMANRCLQAELTGIFKDKEQGDYDTLIHLLENGAKGYFNMEPSELIEEYNCIEDAWYRLHEDQELAISTLDEDPINHMEKVI